MLKGLFFVISVLGIIGFWIVVFVDIGVIVIVMLNVFWFLCFKGVKLNDDECDDGMFLCFLILVESY